MNAIGLQELLLSLTVLLANLPGAFSGNIAGPFLKFFWIFLLRGM